MSIEWTAERLNALPEGTLVGWREVGSAKREYFVARVEHHHYDWFEATPVGGRYTSNSLLYYAVPSSIRVVSVPIDALLSGEAIEAATDAFVMTTNLAGTLGDEAKQAIRAAIAHVTGEAS